MKSRGFFVVGVVLSILLTGCATSQIYAKDKKDGVYFTVPNGWTKISQSELNAREAQSKATGAQTRLNEVTWQEAYSKNGGATAGDVFSLNTPKSPIVYVRVRNLSVDEVQSVSYNSLRNIIVQLTDWINGQNTPSNFSLTDDFESVQKNARGVHTIFSFVGNDGVDQTINQTSLMANDRSKIYVLLVRAKTSQYKSDEKILNKIADSFVVQGAR